MKTFIQNKIKEYHKYFRGSAGYYEDFLVEALEQLAKQKDEEFMELIDIHSFTDAFGDKVVKVESLRNKLQGGKK